MMRNCVAIACMLGLVAVGCGGDDEGTGGTGGTGAAGGTGGTGGTGATGGTGGTGGGMADVCGDGAVTGAETCDDGNTAAGDGCDDTCAPEAGFTCTGEPSVCDTTCGDGVIAGAETCDDGNATAGDGCDDMCAPETGFTCTGEPSVCTATCGDGAILGAETCDDSNTTSGDGCDDMCATENGYTCTGEPSVCDTTCGDGVIAGTETCDDSNATAGDGCDDTCAPEAGFTCTGEPSVCTAICGDGIVAGTETCDDSNTTAGDGCDGACAMEAGYTCTGMPSTCVTVCGDGIIAGAETCDDGNTAAGDGCDTACAVETGYTCMGTPSTCDGICGDGVLAGTETCDDSNTADADGCSMTCQVEVTEIEPNDTSSDATTNGPIDPFVAVINAPGDQDWVAVPITLAGASFATITAEVIDLDVYFGNGDMLTGLCPNNTLDSEIEIYDTDGTTSLDFDDDGGPGWCSLATTTVTTDGTYFVRASSSAQFAPNDVFGYAIQLTVDYSSCGDGNQTTGEECDDGNMTSGDGCSSECVIELCGDGIINNSPAPEQCDDGNTAAGDGCDTACQIEITETEPNDTAGTANPYNSAGTWNAQIGPVGDQDYVAFTIPAGPVSWTVTAGTHAWGDPGTCTMDTIITLYDTDGTTVLTSNDDGGPGLCSLISGQSLAPGTYYIRVEEFGNNATGDYTLFIDMQPEFSCGVGETLVEINASDTPLFISSANPTTTSQITVPDVGTIQKVMVRYEDLRHTFDADLDVFLTSPALTQVELHTDIGGSGDDFIGTLLQDGCPAFSTSSAPYSGCFAPEGSLATFNGEASNGVWTLEVTDDASGDDGSLNSWSIGICIL
ncbi:MAG: DVUA0089 family protein [Polyangiaceae bacterium]